MLWRQMELILRENFGARHLSRRPEPDLVMASPDAVSQFHKQGGEALVPIYRFNAAAIDHLLPAGAKVLDLGSGSGQFLAHLSEVRPDVELVGLELSDEMISVGNKMLQERGLADRVQLRRGDMTEDLGGVAGKVDAVTCVFALHHLPDEAALRQTLSNLWRLRSSHGAAVWLFDHSRPRSMRTAVNFPEIFTPDASVIFKEDSRNSLIASFSFEELRDVLREECSAPLSHRRASVLPLYQAHWSQGSHEGPAEFGATAVHSKMWAGRPLRGEAAKQCRSFCRIMRMPPRWCD